MKKYLWLTCMLLTMLAALSFSLLSCGGSGTSEGEDSPVDKVTVKLWSVTGADSYNARAFADPNSIWAGQTFDYFDAANPDRTPQPIGEYTDITNIKRIAAEAGDEPRSFWIVPRATGSTVVYLHANLFDEEGNEVPLENQTVTWSCDDPDKAFTPEVNGRLYVTFTAADAGDYVFTATSKDNTSKSSSITLKVPETTISSDTAATKNTAMPVLTVITRDRLDIAADNILGILPVYFPACANTYTNFRGDTSNMSVISTYLLSDNNKVFVMATALGEAKVTVSTIANTKPVDYYEKYFIDNSTQASVPAETTVKVYDGIEFLNFYAVGFLEDGADATGVGEWAEDLAAKDNIVDLEWRTSEYSMITKLNADNTAEFLFYLYEDNGANTLGQRDFSSYQAAVIEWSIINTKGNYEDIAKELWDQGTVTLSLMEQNPDWYQGTNGDISVPYKAETANPGSSTTVPLNPGKLLVIPIGNTQTATDTLKLSFDLGEYSGTLGSDPYVVIHSINLISSTGTMPKWVDLLADSDATGGGSASNTVSLDPSGNSGSSSEAILDYVNENYKGSYLILGFDKDPDPALTIVPVSVTISGTYGDLSVPFSIVKDATDPDSMVIDLDQLREDITGEISKAGDTAPYLLPFSEIKGLQLVTSSTGGGYWNIFTVELDVMNEGYSQKADASDIDASSF